MSLLGWSFFALSSEYQKHLLDEIYYLVKVVGFTYHDVTHMPTYERKYFINKLIEENQKDKN